MTVELAMIIPTRGRPENIRKVISAWGFTNAWDVADLFLAVDADDPEIQEYQDLFEEHRNPDTDEPLFHLTFSDTWVPMVSKLDRTANGLALSGKYFALGFAGDDHLPRTINWAQTYLAKLRELKTGLVHGDDGYQGSNICTEWAVTSDVVRALGRMIPAPVEHMYSDVSIHDLMKAADALVYLPQVRIEHMHPIVKKAENDEQYQRVNSREQFRQDKIKYDGWRNGRMSEHLAAVKALQPDRVIPVVPARERPVRPAVMKAQVLRSGPTRRKAAPVMTSRNFPFSREFKEVRGATPDEIGMTLADFATGVPADQEIVELGVFQGRTALILAWGAKQGYGAHVTGIDAWDLEGNTYGPPFNEADSERWAQYRIQELGYADRITLVKNFASDAAAIWGDPEKWLIGRVKPIGLLFVDDDHSYAGARRAVEDWAPHLAPGAIIAIDDYGHPDWPGVEMAVTDLVNEGVLYPVQIYHERLAVTRLAEAAPGALSRGLTAITSEGVSPSPVAPVSTEPGCQHADCVLDHPHAGPAVLRSTLEAEWEKVDPEGVAELKRTAAEIDNEESRRGNVSPEESLFVEGTSPNQPIEELNTVQLRALAKRREIVLGTRKDKRAEMLQALKDGR